MALSINVGIAQDPMRFADEVGRILHKTDSTLQQRPLLFTGSSSIRLWKDLHQRFPDHYILNHGFGGSQTSDLLHYLDTLVLPYNPCRVFIYEGDNDLGHGKTTDEIMKDFAKLTDRLRRAIPDVEIVLISAKPSVARWHLKSQYEALNLALKAFTSREDFLHFADVWTPSLDRHGEVYSHLFVADKLHLNDSGYDIWTWVLRPLLTQCPLTARP